MAGKGKPGATRLGPDHPFRALYAQAGRRWLALLVALALLTWLGLFAGVVRNPGGVKRPWAVVASRAMAAAGAVILIRLLLFSYETRVPVLYARLGGDEEESRALLERLGRGKDGTVPLADIVAFMAERRYVPKGAVGLVVEAGSLEEAAAILSPHESLDVTLMLPPGALTGKPGEQGSGIPPNVGIGGALDPRGKGDECSLEASLREFAQRSLAYLGRQPVCAAVGPPPADPKKLAVACGYRCFLGGDGYNRFGDSPYLVRLLDITPVLRHGKRTSLNVSLYTGLFKGAYIWWPLAALLRAFGASPGWD